MFGIIPFLKSTNKNENVVLISKKEINVSFYYFFVQVIGSLFFAWGSILGNWYTLSGIGLIIKIGVTPFFWWVPPLISRLDWFSIGLLSSIQKIPGLLLLRLMFDFQLETCLFLSMVGFLAASIGIKFSYKDIKKVIAWSSVANMSILLLLMSLNMNFGVLYYIFYRALVLFFCMLMGFCNSSNISSSFLKGKKNLHSSILFILLLVFSGLPPFISFLLKIYFLSGFYKFDSCFLLMDIFLKGKDVGFFYLLGSYLDRWNIVLIFLLLIVVQAVGYIKTCINIISRERTRLYIISINPKRLNYHFWLFIIFWILYLSRLFILVFI